MIVPPTAYFYTEKTTNISNNCKALDQEPLQNCNEMLRNRNNIDPLQTFDKTTFRDYLLTQKGLRPNTAKNYTNLANAFVKSKKSPEGFLIAYQNINSYNNAVKAIKHIHRFLKLPEPLLKCKQNSPDKLIIAPKKEDVLDTLSKVEPIGVKAYLALCATCGLRPQRLLKVKWTELDFDNSIININENIRTKHYRPNPIHIDAKSLLEQLPRTDEHVFNFTEHKVRIALIQIGTKLRPNNLRDFFYNQGRKCGMDRDIIEWLMGHSIGIKCHYLADEIKQEYTKFEATFRIQ